MGERADEVLPPLDVGLEVGDLFLHSIGHFVKAAAQRLDLIAGVQVSAAGVVPGCDLRPGVGQDSQRTGQAAASSAVTADAAASTAASSSKKRIRAAFLSR